MLEIIYLLTSLVKNHVIQTMQCQQRSAKYIEWSSKLMLFRGDTGKTYSFIWQLATHSYTSFKV